MPRGEFAGSVHNPFALMYWLLKRKLRIILHHTVRVLILVVETAQGNIRLLAIWSHYLEMKIR